VSKIYSRWVWYLPASQKVGVPCVRLTMRAPDLGWAARFLGSFLASAESRFDGESTPYPKRVTLAVRRTESTRASKRISLKAPHTMHPYEHLSIHRSFLGASCASRFLCPSSPANRCHCGASTVESFQAHSFCAAEASCFSVCAFPPAIFLILQAVFRVRQSFYQSNRFCLNC
jgi:hypothetical protein